MTAGIFEPVTINGTTFRNRLLRSSLGGRICDYNGMTTTVWRNFERRFARGGLGAIISTTFHVNQARLSPLEYPSIASRKYVPTLRQYVADVKATGCGYIIQIGDPGYATQTSLFPQLVDADSSSGGGDLVYGYNNCRRPMSEADITKEIRLFADAAGRVRDAGADGIEITATKGYLIHQFLNPGINRRDDQWGGNPDNRFRFLEQIVKAVRAKVGRDYVLGIRMSSADFNWVPIYFQGLRLPWPGTAEQFRGNDEAQMLDYAIRLHRLGVDYLHIVSGYGFPSPLDVPGPFPVDEIRMFFNSTRHLTCKAWGRAMLFNLAPRALIRAITDISWKHRPMLNLDAAMRFKQGVNAVAQAEGRKPVHVIVNGGFQEKQQVQKALDSDIDMVSMARALLANWDLPKHFAMCRNLPPNPCTHCNRCVGRTPTSPLGCYEPARYGGNIESMQRQILRWNRS
jgi:2,4-dienoyl-CoA reductase (NADPH2)